MTPEEVNRHFSRVLNGRSVESLCALRDSALRLAAIEAAGDEEVDACFWIENADFSEPKPPIPRCDNLRLRRIAKSRNATIADLRSKLGEALERIQDLEDGIEAARLGL